ncbi:ketosteroid isomerase [Favolaschia claudopus]|uniref:Ketosteroid isomerase n=1 Tax=Favolaschia claudopus TaxID=2862362 RepID=A0AAW0BQ06_9AGAR
MSTFTLTEDYVKDWLKKLYTQDFSLIDPELQWTIGSDKKDSVRLTGVYTLNSWFEEVLKPMLSRLQPVENPGVDPKCIDIIGNNKAILEVESQATQRNGNPYNNRYVWILIFTDEGKVVKIREYLDTALVQEVMQTNP